MFLRVQYTRESCARLVSDAVHNNREDTARHRLGGVLVTNGTATLLGLTVLKDGLIGDIGGIPLLLPWMWWKYGLLSPDCLDCISGRRCG